jgi:hypothetical protein
VRQVPVSPAPHNHRAAPLAPGLNPHSARRTTCNLLPRLRALALLGRRAHNARIDLHSGVRETCTARDSCTAKKPMRLRPGWRFPSVRHRESQSILVERFRRGGSARPRLTSEQSQTQANSSGSFHQSTLPAGYHVGEESIMRNSKSCPKCQGADIVRIPAAEWETKSQPDRTY